MSAQEFESISKALDALQESETKPFEIQTLETSTEDQATSQQIDAAVPQVPSSAASTSDATSDFEATFVRDVTLNDGTVVAAGSIFDKKWLIRNDGLRAWGSETYVSLIAGETFNFSRGHQVPIIPEGGESKSIQPGQEVVIQVNSIEAPETEGSYQSYWKLGSLGSDDLATFGDQLWIDIKVQNENNPSPSSSANLRALELSGNSSILVPFAPESVRGESVAAPSTAAETPSVDLRSESDWKQASLHSPSLDSASDEEDPFEHAEHVSEGSQEEDFELVYQTSEASDV